MPYAFNVFTGQLDTITSPERVYFEVPAGMDLSGHRVVTTDGSGGVIYSSSDDDVNRHGPFWLTMGAALEGDFVEVTSLGEVIESSWAWTPRTAIYLGVDGVLSQTPPSSGFTVQVAVAVDATSIYINPRHPVTLAA